MSLPFLLEIGTEEIPDWMIPPALENLRALFGEAMGAEVAARTDATPRRLVLRADGLPERQPDQIKQVKGPPKTAPQTAVAGFARKQGTTPEQLTEEDGYYTFSKRTPGRYTKDILAEALPELILKIHFPKTMYWTGKNGPRFIRPIRWIVALLGEEVVPFEIGGVRSGNITAGHRILGAAQIPVRIESYEKQLADAFVILSAAERERRIRAGLESNPDEDLIQTLVYLTEYPTVISGSFDDEFLSLPEEVLVTVMKRHQRYFAVNENGRLTNRFRAVMNTSGDPDGLVRRGNERVLRARFSDAKFFWETDQRKKLADRVPDLGHVTFQAKLGSYLDKTNRNIELVKQLGGDEQAVRAAQLAKCDLTTELVKEFPELQGIVGGLYAQAQGEPEPVWRAIYDHYKPLGMEDSIPRDRAGQLVSLADKLDTLRGCFRVGLVPTGSRDPFALRRAANGVVRILVEAKMQLPLLDLLEGDQQLIAFFEDRVRFYFRDARGFRYDEVNAAMAAGWSDLVDLEARLVRVQNVRSTPDFEPLAASFKRIKNILRQADFQGGVALNAQLLEAGPEKELHEEMRRTAGQPIENVISALRPKVDLFFDKVLVNAPDRDTRRNRLSLLHTLLAEFSTIADFSEIVTTGDKQ